MVYTSLQLISRGREAGISVVDLSKKTGYDPKACHYLVDKLLELNLMYVPHITSHGDLPRLTLSFSGHL